MTDLTTALEARIGPTTQWPIRIRAAHAQLTTMRQLMGTDYRPFLSLAHQAIAEHRQAKHRSVHVTFDRRRHLGLLLYPQGRPNRPDTLRVGWALNYTLELLLDDREYETLIEAAIQAATPATDEQ
ncbi:hypothetical protein ACIGBL_35000 [Streptomyces sp. NPDC085614]|uniref:hypothetical protein n=1 Tax=Streptomyces sp. NPDC085614 TaxID=3365733 RepID=UPI0037D8FB67